MYFEVTRASELVRPSVALRGGRRGKRGELSAKGKAIGGLLGDLKSNKKSQ